MPAWAAVPQANDPDTVQIFQVRTVHLEIFKPDPVVPYARQYGVSHRARFFVHFLHHEMLKATLLCRFAVPGHHKGFAVDPLAEGIEQFDGILGQAGASRSSMMMIFLVWFRMAGISEAMKLQPSPIPRTRGLSLRAAMNCSGSSAQRTPRA